MRFAGKSPQCSGGGSEVGVAAVAAEVVWAAWRGGGWDCEGKQKRDQTETKQQHRAPSAGKPKGKVHALHVGRLEQTLQIPNPSPPTAGEVQSRSLFS